MGAFTVQKWVRPNPLKTYEKMKIVTFYGAVRLQRATNYISLNACTVAYSAVIAPSTLTYCRLLNTFNFSKLLYIYIYMINLNITTD